MVAYQCILKRYRCNLALRNRAKSQEVIIYNVVTELQSVVDKRLLVMMPTVARQRLERQLVAMLSVTDKRRFQPMSRLTAECHVGHRWASTRRVLCAGADGATVTMKLNLEATVLARQTTT